MNFTQKMKNLIEQMKKFDEFVAGKKEDAKTKKDSLAIRYGRSQFFQEKAEEIDGAVDGAISKEAAALRDMIGGTFDDIRKDISDVVTAVPPAEFTDLMNSYGTSKPTESEMQLIREKFGDNYLVRMRLAEFDDQAENVERFKLDPLLADIDTVKDQCLRWIDDYNPMAYEHFALIETEGFNQLIDLEDKVNAFIGVGADE